jgi:hypothetical protein
VGASTYQFMSNQNQFYTLAVFCSKYESATATNVTDYFSSLEIQKIVAKHTGVTLPLTQLHNLLVQMKYNYQLENDEFKWLTCSNKKAA